MLFIDPPGMREVLTHHRADHQILGPARHETSDIELAVNALLRAYDRELVPLMREVREQPIPPRSRRVTWASQIEIGCSARLTGDWAVHSLQLEKGQQSLILAIQVCEPPAERSLTDSDDVLRGSRIDQDPYTGAVDMGEGLAVEGAGEELGICFGRRSGGCGHARKARIERRGVPVSGAEPALGPRE